MSLGARQDDPHSRVPRVCRVVVATSPAVALGRLAKAERCCRQGTRGVYVRGADACGVGGIVEREGDLAGSRVEHRGCCVEWGSGQTVVERRRAIRVDRELLDRQARDTVEQGADECSLHHIGLGELVRHSKTAGEVNDRVIRHARLDALIGRPRQNVAEGIEQLDHGVEARGCFVDVNPDLGSRVALERVDIDVGRVIGRDEAVDLESQATVLVTRLLLRRLPGVGAGCKVRCQNTEILGIVHDGVGFAARRERSLRLDVD